MHTYLRTRFLLGPPKWCPGRDLNPHSPCGEKDFKSFASASFATRAGEPRQVVALAMVVRRATGGVVGTLCWLMAVVRPKPIPVRAKDPHSVGTFTLKRPIHLMIMKASAPDSRASSRTCAARQKR
jgi:hypothetical protein